MSQLHPYGHHAGEFHILPIVFWKVLCTSNLFPQDPSMENPCRNLRGVHLQLGSFRGGLTTICLRSAGSKLPDGMTPPLLEKNRTTHFLTRSRKPQQSSFIQKAQAMNQMAESKKSSRHVENRQNEISTFKLTRQQSKTICQKLMFRLFHTHNYRLKMPGFCSWKRMKLGKMMVSK